MQPPSTQPIVSLTPNGTCVLSRNFVHCRKVTPGTLLFIKATDGNFSKGELWQLGEGGGEKLGISGCEVGSEQTRRLCITVLSERENYSDEQTSSWTMVFRLLGVVLALISNHNLRTGSLFGLHPAVGNPRLKMAWNNDMLTIAAREFMFGETSDTSDPPQNFVITVNRSSLRFVLIVRKWSEIGKQFSSWMVYCT